MDRRFYLVLIIYTEKHITLLKGRRCRASVASYLYFENYSDVLQILSVGENSLDILFKQSVREVVSGWEESLHEPDVTAVPRRHDGYVLRGLRLRERDAVSRLQERMRKKKEIKQRHLTRRRIKKALIT